MKELERKELTRIELTTKTIFVKKTQSEIMGEIYHNTMNGFIAVEVVLEKYEAHGILINKGKTVLALININHIVSIYPNTHSLSL